ncbi:MAG: ShlB/FhaC/HecB family hemolysin secretion/activation protein [Rhodocyclaceae bacterium]|nr:ShlB/FhaC/HecB family hemolysin secretion/activation protein [Rhodocyclaceae bacterium]
MGIDFRAKTFARFSVSRFLHWVMLMLAYGTVQAQTPPVPSAGQIYQTLPPVTVRPDLEARTEDKTTKAKAITDVEGMRLNVAGFQIVGMTVMTESDLTDALAPFIGSDKRFQELLDAAAAVKQALAQRGYFLADVIVPEQKIKNGIVTLQVLEGRLGKVTLEVEPDVTIRRSLLESYVAGLKEGSLIQTSEVERTLFQIHDLRGVLARSSFVPGATPGTADLIIVVSAAKTFEGNLDLDANGSVYTGEYRLTAGIDGNNLLGQGDLISFRSTNALDGDLRNFRLSLLSPLGPWGSKVGTSYTNLSYRLGTPTFDPLDASGSAYVASLYGIHPIIRSRNANLLTIVQFDNRRFHDVQIATGSDTSKFIHVGLLGLSGDYRDTLGGGGINVFNVSYSRGKLKFGSPAQAAADEANRQTGGWYGKANFSGSRLQALTDRTALFLAYGQQWGNKNYDASEQFSLGGPNSVRAYPVGEGAGDRGYLGTVELRYRLPYEEEIPGTMVVTAFNDFGRTTLINNPTPADLAAQSPLSARISGFGVGLNWEIPNQGYVRASVSVRDTGDPTADHLGRNPKCYLLISKFF